MLAQVAAFNRHFVDNAATDPDAVAMTGIYTTCMSGLIEVFGWDTMLCAAGVWLTPAPD